MTTVMPIVRSVAIAPIETQTPTTEPAWGPTGRTVYERTYQRKKADGTKETWHDTVSRVVEGNLSLVYGPREDWNEAVHEEYGQLHDLLFNFKALPAGRHLWASGVPGRQYLFNCHVSGWNERLSDHFEFSFMRLMEGGGVGANYGSKYLQRYGFVRRNLTVHIVCDPAHPDYAKMKDANLLSTEYSHEWTGSFAVEDAREGWASALVDLVDTYMTSDEVKHQNRVYDVSRVRAEGQPLRTFGGSASGPAPLARLLVNTGRIMNSSHETRAAYGLPPTPLEIMEIDHEIGMCVVAGGNRRSARMAMVPWDDPFVFDFISCKAGTGNHWTTNISVEIDDQFEAQLHEEGPNRAKDVLKAVVEGMLDNGEPGLWNSSLSNRDEPRPVICTNPCGEIQLMEWENCNLGHINMDSFAPKVKNGLMDKEGMLKAHRLMTRFLMRATYGDVNDSKQAKILSENRRIGVGHFGVQGLLAKIGVTFSRAPKNVYIGSLLEACYRTVRDEARTYAFQLRIPEPVKVTTVAPTGSIAKLAGRTEGIHPIYARHFIRRIRFSSVDPEQWATVQAFEEAGYKTEPCQYAANTHVVEFPTEDNLVSEVRAMGLNPNVIESADEISLEDMLAFQAMYQKYYADNSVSFTVNFPPGSYSVDMVTKILTDFFPKLKGTTLMPDGSRPQAPYERISESDFHAIMQQRAIIGLIEDSTDEECANGSCPVR